jgi:hypothetical protein
MERQNKNANQILEALNILASLLADYGHKWTLEERRLYGRARRYIISFCGVD